MIVSILLIVVYCLSAVCAADVNATCDDVKINEGSDIDLLGNQDSCDKLHSCDENQNAGDNGKSLDSIEIHPPQLPHEIYGPIYSKCEDFDELQRLIYEHNVVDLNKDYSLDCDQTFKINTGVTIDGHGHSIKLAHKGQSYIESNFGNVILKNLKIYNGYHNGNGGALVIGGKACFTLINCTFSDNYAVSCGAVYNSNKNPLKIIDCVFKNNKVNFDKRGKGGAICSEGYLEVIGSLFEGNSADGMGAIWCKGDCFIANSTFKNNYANVLFGAVACDGHMSFINSTAEDNYCKEGLYMQIDAYKGITFDEGTYRYKNNAGYDNLSTVSLNKSVVNLWLDDIKDLDILSDYIKNNNPSWGLLNITLAPYACFFVKNNIEDPGCGYAMRLNLGLVVINGNSGSVIRGGDSFFDENADSFADIIPTCNLGMNNVILENFKIAFMNMGNIYCANSNFNHIEKLAYNAGKACFDNCTFKIMDDKSYTYIECIQDSLSVLTECKYVNWKNVAITGRNHSSIVVFAKNPMENIFKKSDVSNESSFTIVNIDKIGENCTVFNCTNEDEFDKAVSTINLFSPGGNIIINLQPKVYNLKCDLNNMLTGHAYLSVGYAPVVINGNGATIKLDRNDYAFANIGVNGILYVNNVTFSGFACVFTNGGNLFVSNCSFINDHKDDEHKVFVGMIISTGGKSYVTGCNFINKPDSFNLHDGAELHFSNCDFTNKDKIGTAFNSIIYCPKEFAGKFETRDGSENNYHYNDIITDEGVFDPKPTVNITIENSNKFIMVNIYLKDYTPSGLVLDILCDCNINLNDFNSLESLTIHGNGHKISFNSSTINENLFITVSDLTFSDYKCKCLFENKGIMAFNNCSFINNHFEKYLVNNLEGCIFKNCTFNNNGAEYLIYNEGLLLFSNCSFDNNKISGRIDGKPCLIYSKGIVLIYNSTFINCGNQVVLNYNTLNSILFNSHGIKEVFKIVKPQPVKKKSKPKWLMYVIGAGVFVLGIVTAGVGYAVAISAGCAMVAALTIGAGIGIIAGNIAAYGGAYLVSSKTGANMHNLYEIYSVLGTIGALIGAFGASFLLAPAVSSGAAASGVGTTVGAGVAGEEVGSSVVENTGGNGAQNIPETNVPSGTGHPTNPTGDNPVLDPKSGYIDEVSKKVSKLKDDVVDIYRFFHDNAVELYGNQQVILKATDLVHIIEKDALQFQNEMKNVEEYKELCDEMHMLESKAHEVVSILDSGRNFTAKEFNALVEGIIDEYVKILKNFGNYFHPIEFNPDSL